MRVRATIQSISPYRRVLPHRARLNLAPSFSAGFLCYDEIMDDLDIWRTAKLAIDRYGADAVTHARDRAAALRASGDVPGAAVWRRVEAAIATLQATEPVGTSH